MCRAQTDRKLTADANGAHAASLQSAPHSSLSACQRYGERGPKRSGLLLDYDARKTTQDHLDAAPHVHATARTVYVTQADRNALDGPRVSAEFLAEPSSDVVPVALIEPQAIHSDVGGNSVRARSVTRALQRSGHALYKWCSLLGHGES